METLNGIVFSRTPKRVAGGGRSIPRAPSGNSRRHAGEVPRLRISDWFGNRHDQRPNGPCAPARSHAPASSAAAIRDEEFLPCAADSGLWLNEIPYNFSAGLTFQLFSRTPKRVAGGGRSITRARRPATCAGTQAKCRGRGIRIRSATDMNSGQTAHLHHPIRTRLHRLRPRFVERNSSHAQPIPACG